MPAALAAAMQTISITQPDDLHLHLRDSAGLRSVAPHSAAIFRRAVIMPNLRPPVTTTAQAPPSTVLMTMKIEQLLHWDAMDGVICPNLLRP